ncbi:MAG: molybdate ABC transporter permease subunit [Synergistaceae bacterium]|jgi:molybdate transport system permease protein|nr:molybdate ABC transporter permease subunit [Synergistaceae bacterium]
MSSFFLIPLALTLKVAGSATVAAFLSAVPFAFLVSKRRLPFKRGIDSLCTLPMVLPPTVMGYYLLLLLGRNGPLGRPLDETFGVRLVFTWQGAAVAAAVAAFPLIYRSARAGFEGVNVHIEEAARDLGASELRVFWNVSLPMANRGIVAGCMLAFARAMGEFGATMMLAGNLPGKTQTLSLAIYTATQAGNSAAAFQLTLFTSVVCTTLLWGAEHFLKRPF